MIDNIWLARLIRLKIFYNEDKYGISIRKFLSQLSELISLEICAENNYKPPQDGSIWDELINSSLPLLKIFRFCFTFILCLDINHMMTSFSTPFYLSKKRCYVCCDINYRTRIACLYSLPFAFQHFTVSTSSFNTRLTNLFNHDDRYDIDMNMYKNVKTMIFNYPCKKPHSNFRPYTINELILNTPNRLNNWLSFLIGLCHLSLGHQVIMTSNDFRCLLENSFNLHYLTTEDWNNHVIYNMLSSKIRKLNLDPRRDAYSKLQDYIKLKDLQNVIQIFATNCEHLRSFMQKLIWNIL
jgi:hypothetical protein